MKEEKILHLLTSNVYSGAENEVCQIISKLKQDYNIVYCSPKGPISTILKEKNISFYELNSFCKKEVKKAISEFNPTIVHAHDFTASVMATRCNFKGKIISHIHHSPPFLRKWCVKSLTYLISSIRYDQIVIVSESIMRNTKVERYIKSKLNLISNFIDCDEVLKKSMEYTNDEEYDLVYLGRLVEVKNPLRFIKLVERIKEIYPSIKAIMIGDGELRNECEKIIKERSLKKNIDLVGYYKNPFPTLSKSKIVVMTSEREGFGLTAVEGMILGKPVVASNVGGLIDIVNSECGKLCNSDQEYCDEIITLLTNKEKYMYKSIKAKENVKRYIDGDIFQENLLMLYSGCSKNRN
ncbi:glycosyltransferase [Turicibacter sanguinis]|uniref:glycosyltransferase n=1 Tax=Turicibacter sanguinis TaxID=154288 RepID=UPI0006C34F8F|nr:glycosyltransferase [Turicibacter sanguinis]MDB8576358.1 glycosyltransferase [Turicibacter sanguinis]MDB8579312.1 glycosyltransferase [Turicibacter sanguinis]MDB8585049.1 glycosyltransferase [Turicibacter sanguinis]MDB8588084.1 glycosyltransferase [Turicibacter sanguinis]MDB8598814.1 glycosyltransferase [Turicibacter sanguinis]